LAPQALKVLLGRIPDERIGEQMSDHIRKSPVNRKVGGVFVPVRDVQKAKEWYCKMLGIPEEGEVQFGHLYVLPLDGLDLILDEMPRWGGENEKGAPPYETPAFMFQTDNIQAAYEHIKALGAELATDIQNNHWFACDILPPPTLTLRGGGFSGNPV
jgi:catechol 2,3-dioxygenase-like lactoylglutathione lyase family enzyme